MEDHLVLCNWSPRGVAWIHEVHAKSIQDKRPVVIIHDAADEIELPTKEEDVAVKDVYIVKGDPTNEVVLRRASVPTAHSVVILSDGREGKHADGKSVLTCITIRSISRGAHQPNISVNATARTIAATCGKLGPTNHLARHRDDRKSCLLIGIQRGDEMHLNPIGGEAGPLNHHDQLIVLCRVFIQPTETLPTDPPIAPSVESN
jgi:TrkA-N domain